MREAVKPPLGLCGKVWYCRRRERIWAIAVQGWPERGRPCISFAALRILKREKLRWPEPKAAGHLFVLPCPGDFYKNGGNSSDNAVTSPVFRLEGTKALTAMDGNSRICRCQDIYPVGYAGCGK